MKRKARVVAKAPISLGEILRRTITVITRGFWLLWSLSALAAVANFAIDAIGAQLAAHQLRRGDLLHVLAWSVALPIWKIVSPILSFASVQLLEGALVVATLAVAQGGSRTIVGAFRLSIRAWRGLLGAQVGVALVFVLLFVGLIPLVAIFAAVTRSRSILSWMSSGTMVVVAISLVVLWEILSMLAMAHILSEQEKSFSALQTLLRWLSSSQKWRGFSLVLAIATIVEVALILLTGVVANWATSLHLLPLVFHTLKSALLSLAGILPGAITVVYYLDLRARSRPGAKPTVIDAR